MRGEDPDLDRYLGLCPHCYRKKRLNLSLSPYTILQILSGPPVEKIPLIQVLTDAQYKNMDKNTTLAYNQPTLFEI